VLLETTARLLIVLISLRLPRLSDRLDIAPAMLPQAEISALSEVTSFCRLVMGA
jgi:hypothetical protein